MIVESQQAVLHALSDPAFYGPDVTKVERIDTHISVVFLAGSRVFKLKRAVKFDYVNFSTIELRRAACLAEVAANRRAAPSLYRGVVAITRAAGGGLELGGAGTAADYVVEMSRFDQETLFDRLAGRGLLTRDLMVELAAEIASFHARAEPRRDHGGLRGMTWVVDGNLLGLRAHAPDVFAPEACQLLEDRTRAELARVGSALDARRTNGFVRQCHGDLHLRNICLVEGAPTLFDAIEFNDELSCVDTAYDLAFLLMDLIHRRLRPWANVVLNEYARRTTDTNALALLPLFLSCRAAVRAKIGADAAEVQSDRTAAASLVTEARDYLALALQCLEPRRPSLVAIGGVSGTGKSTVAARLAPFLGALPGAIVLRTDEIRKKLWGAASLLDRLPAEAYSADMSARVYDTLAVEARAILRTGHSVVVDAVFLDPRERSSVELLSAEERVPFAGAWLEAPRALLMARVQARTKDVSDATPEVVVRQLERESGDIAWTRFDAAGPVDAVTTDVGTWLTGTGVSVAPDAG